jgi:hypothetical protein
MRCMRDAECFQASFRIGPDQHIWVVGEMQDEHNPISGAPLRRRTLLAELELPTDHFIRRDNPLPAQLVTTGAVALLPECFAAQLREVKSHGSHVGPLSSHVFHPLSDPAQSDGASIGVPHGTHVGAGQPAVQATAEAGAADASHGVPDGAHVGAGHADRETLPDAEAEETGAEEGLEGRACCGDVDKAGAALACNRFPGGIEVPATKSMAEAGVHEAVKKPWGLEDLGFPCPTGILLQVIKLHSYLGAPFCWCLVVVKVRESSWQLCCPGSNL